jgi:type II secretory pathway pseudopilin PulG
MKLKKPVADQNLQRIQADRKKAGSLPLFRALLNVFVSPFRPRAETSAFSMVEVVLALGVTSFSLLAILGLLSVALKSNQSAVQQTAANGILSSVTADLRAAPPTFPLGLASSSQQFSIPIPANPVASPAPAATLRYFTSEGEFSTTRTGDSRYLLTVTFLPNGSNSKTATFVKLEVSWPAVISDPSKALGSVQTFVALDRN